MGGMQQSNPPGSVTVRGVNVGDNIRRQWDVAWNERLFDLRHELHPGNSSHAAGLAFDRESRILGEAIRATVKDIESYIARTADGFELSQFETYCSACADALRHAAASTLQSSLQDIVGRLAMKGQILPPTVHANVASQGVANISARISEVSRLLRDERKLLTREARSRDSDFLAQATTLAARCVSESRTNPAPKVAALAVRGDVVVGAAYRGELKGGDHAEFTLFEKLAGQDLSDVTLYVTLEPCSTRPTKPPCVTHIIAARIPRVVIAMLDPNRSILGEGVLMLQEAGIHVDLGGPDSWRAICAINTEFYEFYRSQHVSAASGSARDRTSE